MQGGPRSLRGQVAHQTGAEEVRAGAERSLDSELQGAGTRKCAGLVQVGGWEVGEGRENTVTC